MGFHGSASLKIYGVSFGLLLAGLGNGLAAELGDAKATVDEVVADTSFLIPLSRSNAHLPFRNFRYPYVDSSENVLFISNDAYAGPPFENSGIYRSFAADGRIEAVVKQEQTSPDDGKPVDIIVGLQTDFKSILYHRGPGHGIGMYGLFDGGPITTIANLKTAVPNGSGSFTSFDYGDVWDGSVIFSADWQSDTTHQGLYFYNHAKGNLLRLLDDTQNVPAAGGSRLVGFSLQPRIDCSRMVFSAFKAPDQPEAKVAGCGILGWSLNASQSAAKLDEKEFSVDKLELLAPFGMEIPESGGRHMMMAQNPVTDAGFVAMTAGEIGDPADPSTYYLSICVRSPDGVWHNPVDTNTINPRLKDGSTFLDFNQWVALHEGQVIFRASGKDNYRAIYLYNVEKDILYFVIDTTRQIDGKDVIGFETSTHPMSGQRMALMVRFSDRTSGVYLATLPGLPVTVKKKPISR